MTAHVMIDIETLGSAQQGRPAVVQIGAVTFNARGVNMDETFNQCIDRHAPDMGEIDCDTVWWWLGQSEEARQAAFHGSNSRPTARQLFGDFIAWVQRLEGGDPYVKFKFWAKPISFDLRIIRSHCEHFGLDIWPFRSEVDLRSACFAAGVNPSAHKPEVAHDALSDAIAQAQTAVDVLRKIESPTTKETN